LDYFMCINGIISSSHTSSLSVLYAAQFYHS
jgi:hypothetical protein